MTRFLFTQEPYLIVLLPIVVEPAENRQPLQIFISLGEASPRGIATPPPVQRGACFLKDRLRAKWQFQATERFST